MSSRREFLKQIGLGVAALALPGCVRSLVSSSSQPIAAAAAKPPNFIFILSDDQGWTGSSVEMVPGFPCSSSDYIETPNLARLAQNGMRFSHAYSPAAMCSPTRYGIQYGRTPAALLKTDNYGPSPESFKRLATSEILPQILKKSNPDYVTAHFGKWHIHGTPEELGYDRSDGPTGNATGNKNIPPDDPKLIFSITRRAHDFIKEQVEAGNPFYMQVSHYAVHLALMALRDTQEAYENKPPGTYHKRPIFGACTQDLDTGIGMLLDMVEKLGIKDNTYIFFMSDNGALAVRKEMRRVNLPLRHGKFSLFEGGIRVPFIACGPGITGNSTCRVPVSGCDLLPTVIDLAGGAALLPGNLDGGSLRNVLHSKGEGSVQRKYSGLYFHCTKGTRKQIVRRQSAIRLGEYKLLKNYYNDNEVLLFNVVKDPGELHDLSEKLPEKTHQMHTALQQYLKRVGAESAELNTEEKGWMDTLDEMAGTKGWGKTTDRVTVYPVDSFKQD